MSAVVNRSDFRGVRKAEWDIKEESGADRKAELRRQLTLELLVDSTRDSKRYVTNYSVGRGAE